MREFARLVRRQLVADARRLPDFASADQRTSRRLTKLVSVGDVRGAARRALPRAIFDFIDGAAEDELVAGRNQADFARLALNPRYFVDVSELDTRTTVLGTTVAVPILGAPMGLMGMMHVDGEVAMARALHTAGSISILSTAASYSIEDVALHSAGPMWFQLYVWRDRGFVRELIARARAAGCLALVVTADGPRTGRRERDIRNGFGLPPRVTARSLFEGMRHPRWAAGFVGREGFVLGNPPPGLGSLDAAELAHDFAREFDPSVSWSDLAWLREQWDGPLVVKGLLRADDAAKAIDVGAQGIVVSNHGGRQLAQAPSSVTALIPIIDAVGDRAEVYVDGGIRRGGDVVKAMALGARACLVGRPLAYGLAVAGEAGAAHVMSLLTGEFELTLALCGCPSVELLPERGLVQSAHSGGDLGASWCS